MSPPLPGTARFWTLPMATSLGPTSCISPLNCSRPATGPASDSLGPPMAFIWSRKPLTIGSSGMRKDRRELQDSVRLSANGAQDGAAPCALMRCGMPLVDGDRALRVAPVLGEVVEEDAHHEPEAGPLDGAFRLEGGDG